MAVFGGLIAAFLVYRLVVFHHLMPVSGAIKQHLDADEVAPSAARLVVLVIAIALVAAAGASSLSTEMSRLDMLRSFVRLAPGAVQSAPVEWQVAIGIAFVVVNTLLYFLLRRAPRGVDA
jgi:hypothetical protein